MWNAVTEVLVVCTQSWSRTLRLCLILMVLSTAATLPVLARLDWW